jgi:hypothetical protein
VKHRRIGRRTLPCQWRGISDRDSGGSTKSGWRHRASGRAQSHAELPDRQLHSREQDTQQ